MICLVLVALVRWKATKSPEGSTQRTAVLVAMVSFVLWVYAMGGYVINWSLPPGAVSVAIGVWTVLVPYFYDPE